MLRIISFLVQFIKSVYLISSFSIYKVFSGNNKTEGEKRETSGSVKHSWNIIFLVSLQIFPRAYTKERNSIAAIDVEILLKKQF